MDLESLVSMDKSELFPLDNIKQELDLLETVNCTGEETTVTAAVTVTDDNNSNNDANVNVNDNDAAEVTNTVCDSAEKQVNKLWKKII